MHGTRDVRNSGSAQHAASPDCWCEPELVHVEDDGSVVWCHREPQ
jgi:hypothetical protein